MGSAEIIDGKAFASQVRADVGKKTAILKKKYGLTPGLAVVLVGNDPASEVYVKNKGRSTLEAGMQSFEYKMDSEVSQEEVLARVENLNIDDRVNGILVQLPLPNQVDTDAVIASINPEKDVDGFHINNVGLLNTGQDALIPCTPLGCLLMLKNYYGDLSGKNAVVLGRSNIVGKPMGSLLLRENCTVTIVHSRTIDLPNQCRQADILIAAVGKPEMVKSDWVKPGAVVIDVGINRIERDGKSRLVGDVDFTSVSEVAGAITPVPGGVGPMTIACLLKNTLTAACRQAGISEPE